MSGPIGYPNCHNSDVAAPRIIFVNGPTAAGKTTAARKLLEKYGRRADFAIVERDLFEDLAGRMQVEPGSPIQHHIWEVAMPVMTAASKAYLRQGFSVIFVLPFDKKTHTKLNRTFATYDRRFICLLPTWRTNRARRMKRMNGTGDAELQMFGWDGLQRLHEHLGNMADDGLFDEVIDSGRLSPTQIAYRLARHLPLH